MVTKPQRVLPRFLARDLDPEASEVTLPPDEARHATRVLRLGPGHPIAVFDGRGNEFIARIVTAGRNRVTAALESRVETAPEPSVPLTLVQAVLKTSAMDDVVRDATMMGVAIIQPVITAHTVTKTSADSVDRWKRVAVSSAKQCRRATIPPILTPLGISDWLRSNDRALSLMFVEPTADANVRSLREFIGSPPPRDAALIVGPEGGWSPEELVAAVASRCVPVTLGQLTLRADAVPVAAIAAFRLLWE
jgi:16S rRNA (uracil1498-N3)-methyltransferase